MLPAHLRREILFLLTAKAVALTLLYILFFAPAQNAPALSMAAHLLGGF